MEIHSAAQIQEIIRNADFKMNPYAQTYFNAYPEAEDTAHLYGATVEKALKMQTAYFFSNQRASTPTQKQVKKSLMKWAQEVD